jgi:hypothetical protein
VDLSDGGFLDLERGRLLSQQWNGQERADGSANQQIIV